MSTTATTMIHARVPKKLRDEAKKASSELGISLSLIVEQALRNFTAAKQLVVEKPLVPTPYLENILREADKDIEENNIDAFSPVFTSIKDMDAYLDRQVAKCK